MTLYMESCASPAVGPRFELAAAFTRLYIPCPAGAPRAAVNQETNHSKKENIMVSTIGAAGLAQSLPARVEGRKAPPAVPEAPAPATTATADAGTDAGSVQSPQSAATARVGGQLDAQFDAARVQRAQDEAAPAASVTGEEEAATAAAAKDTEAGTEAAPAAGGARMGGAAAGSSSTDTDYIAEADTNKDRKVSEEERIAYEKKQASEAEKSANGSDMAQESRAQAVQQAYLPQATAGSQLDTSA